MESAAFDAAYAVNAGCTMLADREEMLTIAPPPPATMCGTASWLSTNALVTLKRNAASRLRRLVCRNGRGIQPPALFTRMSSRPNSCIVASTTFAS